MVNRGDICWYRFERPDKKRPVLVLTRDALIPSLGEAVVAPLTTAVRGVASEVPLGPEDGMPRRCVVNLLHLAAVPRGRLGPLVARLPENRWPEIRRAALFALGFEP